MCGVSLDHTEAQNCEQLKTLNASETTKSMHASAVRTVFGLPLPVFWILRFVADHAQQYVYVSILRSSTYSFFSKFGNNCSKRNIA